VNLVVNKLRICVKHVGLIFFVGAVVFPVKKSKIIGVILSGSSCAVAEGTLLRRARAAITTLSLLYKKMKPTDRKITTTEVRV
jgi:hypothetical protein